MFWFLVMLAIEAVLFVATAILQAQEPIPGVTPNTPYPAGSNEGTTLPVIWGTVVVSANAVDFQGVQAVPEKEHIRTSVFSSKNVTVGYSYQAIMQVLLCHGPVDELVDVIWEDNKSLSNVVLQNAYAPDGTTGIFIATSRPVQLTDPVIPLVLDTDSKQVDVNAPELFGGFERGGGATGTMTIYKGTFTQPTDETLANWHAKQMPKYNGLCHVVLGLFADGMSDPDRFNFGEGDTISNLQFVLRRTPSNLGLDESITNIGSGANPAECIYEVLTNQIWGLGIPETFIDIPSFQAAANTLAGEGFGFHTTLSGQESGSDIIGEVLRYIDGNLQQHPVTGLFVLTLNRFDYDIESLITFDENNSNLDITRPSWANLVNEVKVTYTAQRGSLFKQITTRPIQDIAGQRMFGEKNSVTIDYSAVHDPVLAAKLAARNLRVLSIPLAKATGTVDRTGAPLTVGMPFRITSDAAGVDAHVFRIASIDYGTRVDGKISIEAVEDVFDLDLPTYDTPIDLPANWEPVKASKINVIPIATEDAATGILELQFEGGGGTVTHVQFQEQSGQQAPSAWHDNTSVDGFITTVDKDEHYGSRISWQVLATMTDGTEGVLASGDVSYGVATRPGRPILGDIVEDTGDVTAVLDVDADTVAVKVLASTTGLPTLADVLASAPIAVPAGTTHVEVPDIIHVDPGEAFYISAVAIDANGIFSNIASLTPFTSVEGLTKSLTNFTWIDSADGTTRTFSMIAGSAVDYVFVFDHIQLAPPTSSPWPTDTDLPSVVLTPDPVTRAVSYTATKPQDGFQRFLQFEARINTGLVYEDGQVLREVVDPAPAAMAVRIKAAATNGTADLTVVLSAGVSDWPVQIDVFEDDFTAPPIATALGLIAGATITKTTIPSLGARPLPQRALRHWWVRATNVAGNEVWDTCAVDRDALASGTYSVTDYQAVPVIHVTYDDDTDGIRITLSNGAQKVFTRLGGDLVAGGGIKDFAITDAVTTGVHEDAMVVDEIRQPYLIEVEGGGQWTQIGFIQLHGQSSHAPTLRQRAVANANKTSEDLFITVLSDVAEGLQLELRDAEDAAAPVYVPCVSSTDATPVFVNSGFEFGPTDYFSSGSTPVQKLAAIALVKDQIKRIYANVIGQDSGVQSGWLTIPLSLKGEPILTSSSASWDDVNGVLRCRCKGGANCASVFIEASSSPTFTSPTTFTVALADGADVTETVTLTGAQVGKPWYVRFTPFNAPAAGGIAGVAAVQEVDVPKRYTVSAAATENTAAGQGTLTLTVADPKLVIDQTAKITFWKTLDGGRTGPFAATSGPVGTTGAFVFTFNTDAKHNVKIEPQINFADGTSLIIGAWTFDIDRVANVVAASAAYNFALATITAVFDTDTVIGAGHGRFQVDGGGFTTFTVGSDLKGQFTVATSTTSRHLVAIQGQDVDGNWGPSYSIEVDAYDPSGVGIAQGTISIVPIAGNTSNQAHYRITVDGPTQAASYRYLTSLSNYPVDSTTASSGNLITGARTVNIDDPSQILSLGQEVFVTIIPFTGGSGTGTQLASIHLRGAFTVYASTKSVTYAPEGWAELSSSGFIVGAVWDSNNEPGNVSLLGGQSEQMLQQVFVPPGVKLHQAVFNGVWNSASQLMTDYQVFVVANGVQLNFGSFTAAAGAQSVTLSLADTVVDTVNPIRFRLIWSYNATIGSPSATFQQCFAKTIVLTYIMPTTDKSY